VFSCWTEKETGLTKNLLRESKKKTRENRNRQKENQGGFKQMRELKER
jgi:hypothetical protein